LQCGSEPRVAWLSLALPSTTCLSGLRPPVLWGGALFLHLCICARW
jgi:hypothetical protein